ncbi:MAG: qacA 3, partial [Solirubrobacterales bacterium]|nr:qacA 3 [Solirubrobacterales bacterium]
GHGGILFSMCLALVLVVASVSALNLSLPNLAVDLHASSSDLTWIADAYTVALAALVLPLGALGDRLGRRSVLVAGTVVFGAAALTASFAQSASFLIACRVGMGIGAAMIMPGTLATITAAFPPDQRARGVATWSGFAAAGSILGLLAAGLLLEQWGWQSIFRLSAIIAVLAGAAALKLAPNTHEDEHGELDLVSGACLALAIGTLVYGIIEGSDGSYGNGKVFAAFAVTAISLFAYVMFALRHPNPLLDPRLLKLRGLGAGAIVVTVQFLALFGFFFVGLQYLQLILGYSPLKAALAMVPVGIVVMPLSRVTPRLVARLGMRIVMVSGLLLLALSFGILAQITATSGYPLFLLGVIFAGMGIALSGSTGTTAITGSLGPDKQGVASAINDATREIGASLGIAIMGSTYSSSYISHLPSLAGLPPAAISATHESAAAGLHVAKGLGTQGRELSAGVQDAFITGLGTSLTVAVVILGLAAVAVALRAPGEATLEPQKKPSAVAISAT